MSITYTNYAGIAAAAQYAAGRRIPAPLPVQKEEMGPDETIITWSQVNQTGACGVSSLYSFGAFNSANVSADLARRNKAYYSKEGMHQNSGGCGFASAAFIDTPECKAMYKQLKEWFPILYQSPIRFNVNSGNNFFFCIFDTGEKKVPDIFSDEDHEDFEHLPSDAAAGFPNGLEWQ